MTEEVQEHEEVQGLAEEVQVDAQVQGLAEGVPREARTCTEAQETAAPCWASHARLSHDQPVGSHVVPPSWPNRPFYILYV